jgi:DNA-binding NarL/FixJ family response regulator
MTKILLVADSASVRNRVHAALAGADITIIDHADPKTAAATAYAEGVDSVLVDMQVGSMGAMAVSRAVRAEAGKDNPIPVTILLDRKADAFLAKRAGASNWVSKDQSPTDLREAVGAAS